MVVFSVSVLCCGQTAQHVPSLRRTAAPLSGCPRQACWVYQAEHVWHVCACDYVQGVSNVCTALGKLGHVSLATMSSAARVFVQRADEFKVQETCNLLWAMTQLRYHPQVCDTHTHTQRATHTHTHTHTKTHTHREPHTHTHVYAHTRVRACIPTQPNIGTPLVLCTKPFHVCVRVCVCVRVYCYRRP